MKINTDIVKKLEQQELLCRCSKVEENTVTAKVEPTEPTKGKSVCKFYHNGNSATNWWLALIAFLLFFMLCTNPNFE